MGSNNKRQQTAAKRAREQAVKERRARKLEKRQARRAQAETPAAVEGVEEEARSAATDAAWPSAD
jgi:hypothetical protein